MNHPLTRRPSLWLALGAGLVVLSQVRFGLGLLAWAAPIPLLHYLRITTGWRSRAAFVGVLLLAWELAVAKIVTDPIPFLFTPLFAAPLTLTSAVTYLGWSALRRRVRPGVAAAAFASLVALSEWVLHAFLPFGTWGSLVNTQVDHLALLQLASVTGQHGVSFLMAWFAAMAELALAEPGGGRRRMVAAAAVVVAVVVLGEARLALGTASGRRQNRVAAIDTDSTSGGQPLPGAEESARVEAGLLRRTRVAAQAGAKLIVWTEAATVVLPASEGALLSRVRELAAAEKVHVAAAWIVPVSTEPLRYENKLLLIGPDGDVRFEYLKHRPVPSEPAVPGVGPMPVAEDPSLGRISGAICFDYDFPRLGLALAEVGADVVVLPSSDWRGIDPIHTQMAAIRAIENGASVLRSTRFGLSAAIDPYGRMRAWQSHWDANDGVMLAELPARRRWTFYGWAGDWFIVAAALFAAGALVAAVRARYPEPRAAHPGHSVAGVAGAVPGAGRGSVGGGA